MMPVVANLQVGSLSARIASCDFVVVPVNMDKELPVITLALSFRGFAFSWLPPF
jgi:hypothetical protein